MSDEHAPIEEQEWYKEWLAKDEEWAKIPLPTFALKDEEGWQSWVDANQEPYGRGIVRYAAYWAAAMEREMAGGKKLEDIAERTSHEEAKDESRSISGFGYGAAVSMLSRVWEHGEELRRWHNLHTQIKDEGEKANERGTVLNPAVLRIGE